MIDDQDDLSKFEAPETAHTLPLGFTLLYWGLILWGVYYLWAFSPWGGGWSQGGDFAAEAGARGAAGTSAGTNTFATILFTVIPATAALVLALAMRSRPAKK